VEYPLTRRVLVVLDRQGPSVNVDVMLTGADVEVSRFGSLGSNSQRHE
jgi:hypothetical protein